jgi:hypothetical protein
MTMAGIASAVLLPGCQPWLSRHHQPATRRLVVCLPVAARSVIRTGPPGGGSTELLQAALAARSTGINWTEDTPGTWTAASQGKESFLTITGGEFEARVYHHPSGPARRPTQNLLAGRRDSPPPAGALDYCERELGAVNPAGGTPAEP